MLKNWFFVDVNGNVAEPWLKSKFCFLKHVYINYIISWI